MLFLLPPSETKATGGKSLSIAQVALTFGGLNSARDRVYRALRAVCEGDSAEAAKKLGLSAKRAQEVQINLGVQDSPVMPAIARYSGTLYDAIHGRGLKGSPTEHNTLSANELAVAKQIVFIQSSLFGLIPATDLIPNYRMSASTKLPGLSLKGEWSQAHELIWPRLSGGPIIDLRSKAYAELAPIPSGIDHFVLDVEQERPDGSRVRLNHFNKKAKGQLIHSVLTGAKVPTSFDELAVVAESAGLRLELGEAGHLTLVTREGS